MKFQNIIGLEIHIELKTSSKMFCACSANHFQVRPNTHTCPVCLGLPGALPVPNKKAIEMTIMAALALNCRVNKLTKFDRKNYFYPDLAKGFQISQYDMPLAVNGSLNLKTQNSKLKKIRINRVHLEEDTAKLIHQFANPKSEIRNPKKYSLIDFNRSGVPLMEIVTEPDIRSSEEASEFLKKLQQIIRYLEISDCDMEKGSMRCEVNISLTLRSDLLTTKGRTFQLPNYKVEIKNINSFRFVKKAIEYEIERQRKILETNGKVKQETRGYDEKRNITVVQRWKEEAADYRYFPEPDIPPISVSVSKCQSIKAQIPELPDAKKVRFVKEYGLSEYETEILTREKWTAEYFENLNKQISKYANKQINKQISNKQIMKEAAKWIINKKVNIKKISPQQLVQMILQKQKNPKMDKKALQKIVKSVILKNRKTVKDYQKGKKQALMFLIGEVMKQTKGQADPKIIKEMLIVAARLRRALTVNQPLTIKAS